MRGRSVRAPLTPPGSRGIHNVNLLATLFGTVAQQETFRFSPAPTTKYFVPNTGKVCLLKNKIMPNIFVLVFLGLCVEELFITEKHRATCVTVSILYIEKSLEG